ncbi:MAG: ATPase, partial [Acidobacteria bacterium]|nr:ATPase [Acidobacteriota bacterium]
MSGPWYLGIDGGQTRTRAVVADATGQVVGRGVGGPSNHVEAPGGRDRLRAGVSDSVAAALQQAGLPVLAEIAFASVYCGMTGEADYKHEVIAPLLRTSALLVEHDAPAALAGATVGEAGIIAIAGTGSVVYGETSSGERARTGGWGYLFGDEGSGFGLARDAVCAAL